jgi:hypothetical protein
MTAKRLLTTAALTLVAAIAAPAAAQAGAGPGDDIAAAITPPGDVLPLSTPSDPHILGYEIPGTAGAADTNAYTTEAGETLSCPISRTSYGKTVWGAFRASQYGRLDVTAAGFDSVISLYDATANGTEIDCTDRLAGKIEGFRRDALPTVKKGHVYGVQIGGAVQPDGSTSGGSLAVDLELIRPEVTSGDAVLTWLNGHGGARIKNLKLVAPSGSVVSVGCLKKSCGKVKAFGVSKPVFRQRIAGVNLAQRLGIPSAAGAEKAFAHSAAKPNLKGKVIKNGDTLIAAVQREDEIGVIYFWQVKRNAAGAKNVGCIEPNSTKIKRVGSCTGR